MEQHRSKSSVPASRVPLPDVVHPPARSLSSSGTKTRYHQTQLSAPSTPLGRQISNSTPASRRTNITVALTCPANRQTVVPAPSEAPVTKTIPQMWELARRKKSVAAASLAPEPTSSASQPAPMAATPAAASQPTLTTMASSDEGRRRGSKGDGACYSAERRSPPAWQKPIRQPRRARINAPPLVWGRRRAGRPPRQPSPSPRELYHKASTHFLAFLCEWHGCKAELHNLETLQRHVRVVHGRHRPPSTCRWGRCETTGLESAQKWHAHMETAHFAPLQWHVGDGPRNTSDDVCTRLPDGPQDELPDYLLGPDGQQVTPSIRDQQLEDFSTWKENRRKLKELLILRDSNLPDLSSESSGDSD